MTERPTKRIEIATYMLIVLTTMMVFGGLILIMAILELIR